MKFIPEKETAVVEERRISKEAIDKTTKLLCKLYDLTFVIPKEDEYIDNVFFNSVEKDIIRRIDELIDIVD